MSLPSSPPSKPLPSPQVPATHTHTYTYTHPFLLPHPPQFQSENQNSFTNSVDLDELDYSAESSHYFWVLLTPVFLFAITGQSNFKKERDYQRNISINVLKTSSSTKFSVACNNGGERFKKIISDKKYHGA